MNTEMTTSTGTISADRASFTFETNGVRLEVLSFEGQERLNHLSSFRLRLVQRVELSRYDTLDPTHLIGTPATLTLCGLQATRRFCGILERFALVSISNTQLEYEALLVSTVSRLQLNRTNRIFQASSTPAIIQQVMQDAGLGDLLELRLVGSYPPRDYCVQYQESDWTFIARLMEEEGIFFFFVHEETDVLTLGDGLHAYPVTQEVTFRQETNVQSLYDECLWRFHSGARLRPSSTTLRDYSFKSPHVLMEGQHTGDTRYRGGELYDYPGEFVSPDLGARFSSIRAQAAQTDGSFCAGEGNTRALATGHTTSLTGHPLATCDRSWLITALEHTGSQSQTLEEADVGAADQKIQYRVRLEGIPGNTIFRPQRKTPRPVIPGVQTATVVGPPGETVYPDAWGRVKIKFHWDRTEGTHEHSSCWIRVTQAWSGRSYGVLFLPRIGQEVLVQFIEGDPDRPVIVGRVHNDAQPVPYRLPERKTVSTIKTSTVGGEGFNEVRFEDLAGSEEIFIHGQKDWNILIENIKDEFIQNDKNLKVGTDHAIEIGQNRVETVGMNEQITIGMMRQQKIGSSEGRTIGINRQQTIGVDYNVLIGNNNVVSVGGDQSVKVGHQADHNITKQYALSAQEHIRLHAGDHMGFEAEEWIKLECGQSSLLLRKDGLIQIKGTQIHVKGGAETIIKGGMVMLNPPSGVTDGGESCTNTNRSMPRAPKIPPPDAKRKKEPPPELESAGAANRRDGSPTPHTSTKES